ncbi:hypothetical protein BDR26DRAFT_862153 [Obelidium mucronatum]|nr:hypothetical protein BDR26DRAFT_862153 [Obelidium mucronatum]
MNKRRFTDIDNNEVSGEYFRNTSSPQSAYISQSFKFLSPRNRHETCLGFSFSNGAPCSERFRRTSTQTHQFCPNHNKPEHRIGVVVAGQMRNSMFSTHFNEMTLNVLAAFVTVHKLDGARDIHQGRIYILEREEFGLLKIGKDICCEDDSVEDCIHEHETGTCQAMFRHGALSDIKEDVGLLEAFIHKAIFKSRDQFICPCDTLHKEYYNPESFEVVAKMVDWWGTAWLDGIDWGKE